MPALCTQQGLGSAGTSLGQQEPPSHTPSCVRSKKHKRDSSPLLSLAFPGQIHIPSSDVSGFKQCHSHPCLSAQHTLLRLLAPEDLFRAELEQQDIFNQYFYSSREQVCPEIWLGQVSPSVCHWVDVFNKAHLPFWIDWEKSCCSVLIFFFLVALNPLLLLECFVTTNR